MNKRAKRESKKHSKIIKSRRKTGGSKLKHNKTHNKRHNKKHFVKLNCSPESKLENVNKNDFTCYTDEDLHKLRNMWNARHPDAKIESNNSTRFTKCNGKHNRKKVPINPNN